MSTTVAEDNSQHLPQDGDTSEFDNSLRELAPRELYRLSRALTKQLRTTIAPEFVTLLRAAIVMNLFNRRPLTPKALAGAVVEFGLEANILIEFAAAHDKCFAKEYQALSKSKGNLESIHWAALFLLNAAAKAEIGLSLLLDFEAMVDRLLNRTGEERPASLVRLLHGLAFNPLALPEALLPQPSSVVSLVKSFPNFGEVAQFYAGQIALRSIAGHSALCLPPVLLVGSPGIGKTHFTAELAKAIGLDHHMIPMNSQSGGFVLSGL